MTGTGKLLPFKLRFNFQIECIYARLRNPFGLWGKGSWVFEAKQRNFYETPALWDFPQENVKSEAFTQQIWIAQAIFVDDGSGNVVGWVWIVSP